MRTLPGSAPDGVPRTVNIDINSMNKQRNSKISINGIVGIIVFVLIAFLFVMITGGIIRLLYSWLPLVLFGGALLVNYRTVLRYVKYLLDKFRTNPMSGLVAVVLSVVFYPFVAAFLLAKAFLDRKVRRIESARRAEHEFVEYEDVTETEGLDLKPLEKQRGRDSYDELLDEDQR